MTDSSRPDSVERLKSALETLRYARPDDLTQAADPRSAWSVLVEAERLLLVYAKGVYGVGWSRAIMEALDE